MGRVHAIPFITGNEIKTMVKYHNIPTKWLKLQRVTKSNSSKNEEKLNHSYDACRNVQWYIHSGKLFGNFSKKASMQLPYNPAVALLVIISDK